MRETQGFLAFRCRLGCKLRRLVEFALTRRANPVQTKTLQTVLHPKVVVEGSWEDLHSRELESFHKMVLMQTVGTVTFLTFVPDAAVLERFMNDF